LWNIAPILKTRRYNVDVVLYIDSGPLKGRLQDSAPLVRFSDFLGIGYFGDKNQQIIAPIFDLRRSAESAWEKVIEAPLFHLVFVEHPGKYEFIAYPAKLKPDRINHVLYRSFSSLESLHKFKSSCGGRAFIKFGWHDLTKAQKFDVLAQYAAVDSVGFVKADEIRPGTLADRIRKR
jgi:hypothetical protein